MEARFRYLATKIARGEEIIPAEQHQMRGYYLCAKDLINVYLEADTAAEKQRKEVNSVA